MPFPFPHHQTFFLSLIVVVFEDKTMTTMDQKAISWLGDMYQKIEVIAVENIYQDSVKYVETQVETVGACVEKFYSELVQNLLPLPSGDLVVPENPGLDSVHCADNEICDESEVDVNKEDVKVESENLSSDSDLATELDECLDDTLSSGSCNKDESEEKSLPSQESVLKETPIESVETMSNPRICDGDCAAGEGEICNEMDESHEIDECVPSTSTFSSLSGPTICDEFGNDEDMLKRPNGICNGSVRDEIEINDADEEVLQVSEQQLVNMELDESCVLVDKHQHISVSHLETKQSSYKIRDVFGLRRFSRSKNQEQLNSWLEDTHSSNQTNGEIFMASASTLVYSNTNLQCNNSLESGWEIV